jgi:O-antigen/teichoic acid export membrane protein
MTLGADRSSWTLSDIRLAGLLRIAARGAYVLQGLVLTPLLLRSLGTTDYGLWVLLLDLVVLLSPIEQALWATLVRITASYRAGDALHEARPIVANALLVAITIGGAITLVVLTWGQSLLRLVQLTPEQEMDLRPLLLAGLVLFWAGLLSGVADGILFGTKHVAVGSVIDIVSITAFIGLTGLVLVRQQGLVGVAVAAAFTKCLATVLKLLSVHRAVRELPLSLQYVRWMPDAWSPLSSPLTWAILISLTGTLGHSIGSLVVGSLLSTSAVGAIHVASRIPDVLGDFIGAAFAAMFPYSADLHGKLRKGELSRSLLLGTRIALTLTLLALVAFWYVGPLLLELWVGEVDHGAALLRLALILIVVYPGSIVLYSMLYGCGDFRGLALLGIPGVLAQLSLTVVLTASVGIVGSMLGSIAGAVVVTILMVPRATRIVGLSPWVWWRRAAVPPVVALCPVIPLALALELAHVEQPAVLLLVTVLGVAAYAVSAFMVAFDREERAHARRLALAWLGQLLTLSRAWRHRFVPMKQSVE